MNLYILTAWHQALLKANITHTYPNLIHNYSFGSPIGNPPPINFTFILKNLPSADIQPEYIMNIINEEIMSGHMDGPFTIEEARTIYGGHFWTCYLGLVEELGLTVLQMICHFSNEDQFGHPKNSCVDSDNFPTCQFTAVKTAYFVSVPSSWLPYLCHLYTTCIFYTACFIFLLLSFHIWTVEVHGLFLPTCKFSVLGKCGPCGCLYVAFRAWTIQRIYFSLHNVVAWPSCFALRAGLYVSPRPHQEPKRPLLT